MVTSEYASFKFFFTMFFTCMFGLYGGYKCGIQTDEMLRELQNRSPVPSWLSRQYHSKWYRLMTRVVGLVLLAFGFAAGTFLLWGVWSLITRGELGR